MSMNVLYAQQGKTKSEFVINLAGRFVYRRTIRKEITESTMVKHVESEGEWAELMEQSKEKLVVVDFTATW